MKKETIITASTAIVFLGVGFLSGYIFEANRKSDIPLATVSTGGPRGQDQNQDAAASPQAQPLAGTPSGLPEGHPPVETAALIKEFEDEAAQSPKDPGPRLRLANLFYDQKQYDNAIPWYRQALELDPRNVNARTDLGTAYFYLGQSREALREYRKSLELDPRHAPSLFNIVVTFLEGTHDLAAAEQALSRLEKLNPNYPGLDSLKQRLQSARSTTPGAGAQK